MINKILCFFGRHHWEMKIIYKKLGIQTSMCGTVEYVCKHCGARK